MRIQTPFFPCKSVTAAIKSSVTCGNVLVKKEKDENSV